MLAIIPDVLTAEELARLRALLKRAAFQDGKATAGFRARMVKHNEQAKPGDSLEPARALVREALLRNGQFQSAVLPRSLRPPLFNRYRKGQSYGAHIDDPLMGKEERQRSDVAMTLFLSDPDGYEGGELQLSSPLGPQEVKLPAGAAVVYPASAPHAVAPVTAGERLAAVCWAQSFVREGERREILHQMNAVRLHLHKSEPEGEAAWHAFAAYANLLRLWAEA